LRVFGWERKLGNRDDPEAAAHELRDVLVVRVDEARPFDGGDCHDLIVELCLRTCRRGSPPVELDPLHLAGRELHRGPLIERRNAEVPARGEYAKELRTSLRRTHENFSERRCWNDDLGILLLKGFEEVRHTLTAAVDRAAGRRIRRRLRLLVDDINQNAGIECDDQ